MAYARWDRTSDWYIFWHDSSATARNEQRLAVWHCRVRPHDFECTYDDVRRMLSSGDFSSVPGYAARYEVEVRSALSSFVEDVDLEYDRGDEVT